MKLNPKHLFQSANSSNLIRVNCARLGTAEFQKHNNRFSAIYYCYRINVCFFQRCPNEVHAIIHSCHKYNIIFDSMTAAFKNNFTTELNGYFLLVRCRQLQTANKSIKLSRGLIAIDAFRIFYLIILYIVLYFM